MTFRYLLDTNAVSDVARSPTGSVVRRLADEAGTCAINTIVLAVLRFGVLSRGSTRLADRVENIVSRLVTLPFGAPAANHYADIRLSLTRSGRPIGANDLLIAAHARSLDLTVVTANVLEFARVPDLAVEDWSTV